MPKVRYLSIRFSNALFPGEIPWFRAAVIEKTERQSSLFHNHQPSNGFHYRYPLIQYKVMNRKAGIICLDQGTDDIHYLLQQRDLQLRIGRKEQSFEIEDVQLRYHQVQCWQGQFQYSLKDWQALNQENYNRYQALESEVERFRFLEKMLLGNLLAFARAIQWDPNHGIELAITRFKGERWLPYKNRKVICFSLNFKTNVSLPDFIGLGKGVSVGFGSVMQFEADRPDSKTGRQQPALITTKKQKASKKNIGDANTPPGPEPEPEQPTPSGE